MRRKNVLICLAFALILAVIGLGLVSPPWAFSQAPSPIKVKNCTWRADVYVPDITNLGISGGIFLSYYKLRQTRPAKPLNFNGWTAMSTSTVAFVDIQDELSPGDDAIIRVWGRGNCPDFLLERLDDDIGG